MQSGVAELLPFPDGCFDLALAQLVVHLAELLPAERLPSPIDTTLDTAIITAPTARDPALLAKLDAVCGRVTAAQR